MNVRLCQILSEISYEDGLTIFDLSERFELSVRTIRADIDSINEFLLENNQKLIEISASGKILFDLDPKIIMTLLNSLDFYQYKLSYVERRIIIAYMLLMCEQFVKVQEIANLLSVSRTTINSDLESLKVEFAKYDLKIAKHSNRGLYITGPEDKKREFLLDIKAFDILLRDHLLNEVDREYFERPDLAGAENRHLNSLLKEQLKHFNLELSDAYFEHVVDYCELLIRRTKQNNFIERQEDSKAADDKVARFAESIYKLLIQYFKLEDSTSERIALNEFLRRLPLINAIAEKHASLQIQVITKKFITIISKALCVDLSDDFELYDQLSRYLDRISTNNVSALEAGPRHEEIIKNNPDILESVQASIGEYEEFIGRSLSQTELACIVMHLSTAIERKTHNSFNLEVYLIADPEAENTMTFTKKLNRFFDFKNLKIQNDFNLNNKKNTLVISTIPLPDEENDYLRVSPFLNEEDLDRIARRLEQYRPRRVESLDQKLDTISDNNAFVRQINKIILSEDDVYKTLDQVNDLMANFFNLPVSSNPHLHKLLKEEMIRLDVPAETLEEGVRAAGNILEMAGIIEEPYIKSCLKNMENMDSYFFVGENFLLPHSLIGPYNKTIGFSLVRLRHPLRLHNGREIRWISMMSAVDRSGHLKALFVLANLIQDAAYMRRLETARSPEEVLDIIKQYEYLEHPISVY